MWSISVEEQFYIAIPRIVYYGQRLGLKIVSSGLLVVSYVMVILYAWKGWLDLQSVDEQSCTIPIFSAGTLLGLMLRGRTPKWNPAFRILDVLAGIVCLFLASVYFGVQADTRSSTVLQAPLGWARAGEKQYAAESRLSLAKLAIEEGKQHRAQVQIELRALQKTASSKGYGLIAHKALQGSVPRRPNGA